MSHEIAFPLRTVKIRTSGTPTSRELQQITICEQYISQSETVPLAWKMARMRELGLTPTVICRKLGVSRMHYYKVMREIFGDDTQVWEARGLSDAGQSVEIS